MGSLVCPQISHPHLSPSLSLSLSPKPPRRSLSLSPKPPPRRSPKPPPPERRSASDVGVNLREAPLSGACLASALLHVGTMCNIMTSDTSKIMDQQVSARYAHQSPAASAREGPSSDAWLPASERSRSPHMPRLSLRPSRPPSRSPSRSPNLLPPACNAQVELSGSVLDVCRPDASEAWARISAIQGARQLTTVPAVALEPAT